MLLKIVLQHYKQLSKKNGESREKSRGKVEKGNRNIDSSKNLSVENRDLKGKLQNLEDWHVFI